jgi:hypothetical protein
MREKVSDCEMRAEPAALLDEEQRIRTLRRRMDLAAALLWQCDLTLPAAQALVAQARREALELFPDKADTFDLIYGSRFQRILTEIFRLV